jgi:2'-5' RNA ligase
MAAMRLFVAVWPTPEVVGALQRLPRPALDGIRWTTPAQWHVTVRFLGDVPDAGLGAVAAAWRATATEHAARTVTAGPVTTTFGRSVLVVPVDGIADLLGPDSEGHLTLARSRHRNLGQLSGEPFHASWPVEELTLVRSDTRPDGAVYEVIERWPLGVRG